MATCFVHGSVRTGRGPGQLSLRRPARGLLPPDRRHRNPDTLAQQLYTLGLELTRFDALEDDTLSGILRLLNLPEDRMREWLIATLGALGSRAPTAVGAARRAARPDRLPVEDETVLRQTFA